MNNQFLVIIRLLLRNKSLDFLKYENLILLKITVSINDIGNNAVIKK